MQNKQRKIESRQRLQNALGAANHTLPEHLKRGLIAFEELQAEIDAFSDIAWNGNTI
ncbi:MAG: hypothetical protein P8Y38_10230 [Deltaproteobacteria bacterium]|jgi:hypothetical protein